MLSDHHCHDFSDRFSGDVFYQRRISWRYAAFFVFAIIFTVLMLEKRRALIVSLLEIVLYIGLCLVAYHFPHIVTPFATEADRLADILLAFVSVSIVCGSVLYFI